MRPNHAITERLWKVAEPVCVGAGYELVDLALTQSQNGWTLRVFIDHPQKTTLDESSVDSLCGLGSEVRTGIGFDDCERVSRELSAILDVEDLIEHSYSLEVSSPGLDRPLRKVEHFQQFVGCVAKVTVRQKIAGRRNFQGKLIAVAQGDMDAAHQSDLGSGLDQAMITINVDGSEFRLPFNEIENARLVPDWDAVFQRSQKR